MALSRKISSSIQGVVTSAWNTAARGMGTHTGTVKFFQPKKGFGFLTTESEPGKDVFVHQSDIVSNGFRFLVEGEAVEFDVIESERGLVAQKVTAPGGGPVHENRQDNGSEQVRY